MNSLTLFLLITIPALGSLLHGFEIGIISGAMAAVVKDIELTSFQQSLMVGSVFFGGAISILFGGKLADCYGRRFTLQVGSVLTLVGLIMAGAAIGYDSLLTGRLLQGLGVGLITFVIPLYLTESMPAANRGKGTSSVQFFLSGGIVLAAFISWVLTPTNNWPWMFYSGVIPTLIVLLGSFFIPRSPRWLVMKGRDSEAKAVLLKTRTEAAAKQELALIQQSFQSQQSKAGFALLKQKKFLIPVLLVTLLGCLNMLSGVNIFLGFSAQILAMSGSSSQSYAVMGGLIITIASFLSTIISVWLVDQLGRRFLVKLGLIGLAITLLYLMTVEWWVASSMFKAELMLIGMAAFVSFFVVGPGSMIWLLLTELLPNQVRSIGMACALTTLLFVSGGYASIFLNLVDAVGMLGFFTISLVVSCVYFIIVHRFVPETKGMELEEIKLAA